MQIIFLVLGVLIFALFASGKQTNRYCWFVYFLSFAAHINLCYIYNYPHYVGKQNMGIAVTLSEVAGLGLFLSYLLRKSEKITTEFKAYRRYFVYLLFSFCSIFYSYNRGMSINEIGTEIELLIVICLISFYYRKEHFKYFKYSVLANSILQSILCIIQMFTGVNFRGGTLTLRYGVYRSQGLYITPSELGIISLISFFLFLALYLQEKKSREKWILSLGMACNIVCIIGGQSRTGFLILGIGLLLFALINNYKMRNNSKAMLRLTVLIGIIAVGIAFVTGEVDLGNSGDMLSSRVSMWAMGLQVFFQHPIIGVGNNAYTAFNSAFSTSYLKWEATNPVHNIYILELAETGLVGFFLLFVNFYFPIVKFSYKRSRISVYYETLFIVLFTELIYSFTGWVFYSPSLRFFNVLMMIILMRMGDEDIDRNTQNKERNKS